MSPLHLTSQLVMRKRRDLRKQTAMTSFVSKFLVVTLREKFNYFWNV